jgi:hypothetical protein
MEKIMPDKKVQDKQTLAVQAAEKTAHKVKTVEGMIAGTEAGKIWDEIKDKPIEMFALPEQKISHYAAPAMVEPSKLYLVTRATSVLPSIETAVGKQYTVELMDKYVVVSRTVVPLTKK